MNFQTIQAGGQLSKLHEAKGEEGVSHGIF